MIREKKDSLLLPGKGRGKVKEKGSEKKGSVAEEKEKETSAQHKNIFPGSWEMKSLMNVF